MIMKKLDLHGKNYNESKFLVDIFIENNLDSLPIKIITGNSLQMKNIVKDVLNNYNLTCRYESQYNLGSLIITNKYY